MLGPLYQFINAKATYCCNYWQIYNNLSEISAHKKRLRSTVVVLKKPFYPCRLLCLIIFNVQCLMFDNFFLGTVFLCFTKLVAAITSLTDTVFISEQHLQAWLCIYNVFDRYFYLRRIVTSKEHMQPCIWAVPPLFQEVTFQGPSIFKGTVFLWNKHS